MKVNIVVIFSLIMVATFVGAIHGQSSFNNLSLSISPTKTGFVPLEPITLRIKLENRTDLPIRTHGSIGFSSHYLTLGVENPAGEVSRMDQLSFVHARSIAKEADLPPGGSVTATEVLNIRLDRYFGGVGRYRIRAFMRSFDGASTLSSPWVNIEITQPAGLDSIAYGLLNGKPNRAAFLGGYDLSPIEDLEKFLEAAPNSSYSDHARYLLANRYLLKNDKEKAREQLLILKRNESFVFSEDVEKHLSKLSQPGKK